MNLNISFNGGPRELAVPARYVNLTHLADGWHLEFGDDLGTTSLDLDRLESARITPGRQEVDQ